MESIPLDTCMHCLMGESPHQDWHATRAEYLEIGTQLSARAKVRERDVLRVIPDQALVGYGASLRRLLKERDDVPDFLAELAEDWIAEAEREWRFRQRAASKGADAVVRDAGTWRDRVERVKEWASLAELIAYENAGAEPVFGGKWKCCCPFHADQHPSLDVDVLKRVWMCRSCGVGGDALTYVQLRHGMTFVSAVEHLEVRFGIGPPEREIRGVPVVRAHGRR